MLIITEILFGYASKVKSSTMGLTNSGAGIIMSCGAALMTSMAIIKTNEYISKSKLRYTKPRDWINVFTLLYEKALEQSMVDRKIDEKEALEIKKINNNYIDNRSEPMKNSIFKVEDVFGDVIGEDSFNQEQITKPNTFSTKIM